MPDRHYLKQIVELSEDCVNEIGFDGRVKSINSFGRKLLHAESDDIIVGKVWSSLWPSPAQTAIEKAVSDAKQGFTTRLTEACPTFKGEQRIWRVTVAPLTGVLGEVEAVLAVSRDITESLNAEKALRLLNEALQHQLNDMREHRRESVQHGEDLEKRLELSLENQDALDAVNLELQSRLDLSTAAHQVAEMAAYQAQKGEAIGQLVAGLAHDFNNMLQACVSSLSAVIDKPEAMSERQKKFLKYALDAASHAGVIASRLLAFARIHPYKAAPLLLDEAIKDILPLIKHSVGATMTISLCDCSERLCIVADMHSIEQSFMNLCINARDACRGHGEIIISFGKHHVAKEDISVNKTEGDYAFVEVKDSGEGMSAATLSRMFEPFFTTKPPGKGTGLGMAQIYSTVRGAHGFVEVESEAGKGTSIRLMFPIVDAIECA
ncbi:PAS domain-containing sensor histidine kinase [Dyella acidiphila]|uniref:histidine kinase n=1 Tax=Dyella acidiphila TaxID=2775866 RepID=A0ABR9G6H0_9GAMM|nr:PAS domain-containing sensor histidine kinase [Dyella acidiphila]MBE1159649.1 PAS domain-containing protein [Dyella acidiphila]